MLMIACRDQRKDEQTRLEFVPWSLAKPTDVLSSEEFGHVLGEEHTDTISEFPAACSLTHI